MKKFGKWLLLGAAVLLAGCSSNDATEDSGSGGTGTAQEQKIAVSLPAQLSTLDTTQTMDKVTFTVIQHLFEGLYRLDENSQPVPGLAEAVDISEDGKSYTFTLRDGIKWSNGEAITADDFLFAWKRLVDPETQGPNAYWLDNVVNSLAIRNGEADIETIGLAAPDPQTFVVTLANPQPSFLSVISIGWLAPQNEEFVTEEGTAYGTTSEDLLYSGPFILADWDQASDSWTLKKNTAYYDADQVKLTEVAGSTIKEENTGINLFETGQLQLTKISGQFVQQYQTNQALVSRPEVVNYFLDFNKVNENLKNVALRKAIALAIDKESLVKNILNDGSVVLNGLVPAGLYTNENTGEDFRAYSGDYNSYDPEAAQKAWQQAQSELGSEVALTLLVNDTDNGKKIAEYLQAQLQEQLPGLTITINQQPANNVSQSRREGNYQLSLSGWIAGSNDLNSFFNLYQTDSAYNYGKYENAEYAGLLEKAVTTDANDADAFFTDYQQAEAILLEEDVAQVPIYQSASNYLVDPQLTKVIYHDYGDYFNLREAYLAE